MSETVTLTLAKRRPMLVGSIYEDRKQTTSVVTSCFRVIGEGNKVERFSGTPAEVTAKIDEWREARRAEKKRLAQRAAILAQHGR